MPGLSPSQLRKASASWVLHRAWCSGCIIGLEFAYGFIR